MRTVCGRYRARGREEGGRLETVGGSSEISEGLVPLEPVDMLEEAAEPVVQALGVMVMLELRDVMGGLAVGGRRVHDSDFEEALSLW